MVWDAPFVVQSVCPGCLVRVIEVSLRTSGGGVGTAVGDGTEVSVGWGVAVAAGLVAVASAAVSVACAAAVAVDAGRGVLAGLAVAPCCPPTWPAVPGVSNPGVCGCWPKLPSRAKLVPASRPSTSSTTSEAAASQVRALERPGRKASRQPEIRGSEGWLGGGRLGSGSGPPGIVSHDSHGPIGTVGSSPSASTGAVIVAAPSIPGTNGAAGVPLIPGFPGAPNDPDTPGATRGSSISCQVAGTVSRTVCSLWALAALRAASAKLRALG